MKDKEICSIVHHVAQMNAIHMPTRIRLAFAAVQVQCKPNCLLYSTHSCLLLLGHMQRHRECLVRMHM